MDSHFLAIGFFLLAILCFLLAVFHASVGVDLTNLGLALGFAGFIPLALHRHAVP